MDRANAASSAFYVAGQGSLDAGSAADLPDPIIQDFAPLARELSAVTCRRSWMRQNAACLAAAVMDCFGGTGREVLSLDVFDTLLLRDDVPEAERFWELSGRCAERLGGGDQLDHFLARQEAMRLSYRTRPDVQGCREGCLDDVLRMQCRALGLPKSDAAEMKSIEVELEVESLEANAGFMMAAAEVRRQGGRVVLISDMYLDGATIAEIVGRVCGEVDLFDGIFSSADFVVSKRAGKIFPVVEQALRLPASAFVHWGDSLEADVRRARAAGWESHHFPVSDAEIARRQHALSAFVAAGRADGLHLEPYCQA